MTSTDEPVSIFGALNSALVATIAILAVFGVDQKIIAAITIAVTAWVGFAAVLVRRKVTPTSKVALTHDDVALLEAAKPQSG